MGNYWFSGDSCLFFLSLFPLRNNGFLKVCSYMRMGLEVATCSFKDVFFHTYSEMIQFHNHLIVANPNRQLVGNAGLAQQEKRDDEFGRISQTTRFWEFQKDGFQGCIMNEL